MFKSLEISNFFIQKSHKSGIELTPMKLIKISYLAHGWHLGLFDKELLNEVVCAWKYGPVIESIYHQFKKYENSQITELEEDGLGNFPVAEGDIVPFLDKIWDVYKDFDGIQLSAMTHQKGTPWDTIWNEQNGRKYKHAIIPNDLIKTYFKAKINPDGESTS